LPLFIQNYILRPCPTSTISSKNSIKPLLKLRSSSRKSGMSISSHKNCSFRSSRNATNSSKPWKGSMPNDKQFPKKTWKKNTSPSCRMTRSCWNFPNKKSNWPKNFTILFTNQHKNLTDSYTWGVKNTQRLISKSRVKRGREKAVQTNKNGRTIQTSRNTVTAASHRTDKW
jgi:hypothetical protein